MYSCTSLVPSILVDQYIDLKFLKNFNIFLFIRLKLVEIFNLKSLAIFISTNFSKNSTIPGITNGSPPTKI